MQKNPPTELPSVILDKRGLNQAGYFAVDAEGDDVDWDSEGAGEVCMLGAMYLGFELTSGFFEVGVGKRKAEDILQSDRPSAYEYLVALGDAVKDNLKAMPEVPGIRDDNGVVTLVASYSDNIDDAEIAYKTMVECEVRLGLRTASDLSTVVRDE